MRSCRPSASMISVADWFMVNARRGGWVYVVEMPQLSIVTGKPEASEAAVAGVADSAITAVAASVATRLVIRMCHPAGSAARHPAYGSRRVRCAERCLRGRERYRSGQRATTEVLLKFSSGTRECYFATTLRLVRPISWPP